MEKEILCSVYEQYWQHARHAENNTWLYTSTSSIIMGAIIALMGAEIPEEMKTGASLFGAILSFLGFGVVYTNRVPFLKFTHMAELIAINEFGLKDEYRRFFPGIHRAFLRDKWFDLHDVLATFYSVLAGIMIYFCLRGCFKSYVNTVHPAPFWHNWGREQETIPQ